MSAMSAVRSARKRYKVGNNGSVIEGPENKQPLSDGPDIFELASNTILTLVVSLSSLTTGQ